MNALVPLPVVLPLLAAALKLVLGVHRVRTQRAVSVVTLSLVLAASVALLVLADRDGPLAIALGDWEAPVGIGLVADRFSALMLVVSSAVTLGVLVYSIGQGMSDLGEVTPTAVFHPTYLVLSAGVADAFLAGDLFNLYVGFEMLLVASYVLITVGGTAARVRAGTTYVVVGLASSVIFLAAIGMVYAATGTVNLAQLAGRLDALPPGLRLLLEVMLLVAFGVKAAVFPLSSWLPDSYPTAPAPVTAVFAGLLTKVGVYALIRTQTLMFPERATAGVLMVVALATMLLGILGAVAQTDIKRLLSFTLVSHIGFMVFGVAVATVAGLAGAVFYAVHHITVQTSLFLTTGLVERRGGTTDLRELGGLAKVAPVIGVLFFVPAMNLAGIPPFAGFLAKLGLLQAGAALGTPLAWTLVVASVVTSLLTLYAVTRVWSAAFWRAPSESVVAVGQRVGSGTRNVAADGRPRHAGPSDEPGPTPTDFPRVMVGATAALVGLGVAFTVLAGPLVAYCHRTAVELTERSPYVDSVVLQDVRGAGR